MLFLDTFKEATAEALEKIHAEMSIRGTSEVFLLFSLGSQFDHLIKQALEKLGVFCLVANSASVTSEDVAKLDPIGIILSGGPSSVNENISFFDKRIFDLEIPVLGICLGFQLWVDYIGETVEISKKKEFGVHLLTIDLPDSPLFIGVPQNTAVLQSHSDIVNNDAGLLKSLAGTDNTPIAAGYYKHLWGMQFHPEVSDTEHGLKMFENFCFGICQAQDRFPAKNVAKQKIVDLQDQIDDKTVLLALSGGSDSCTVAYLLKEALGKGQIKAVYIKGIDRPDDEAHVINYFSHQDWLDIVIIDATEKFLKVLAGKISMRDKRIAMRSVYKEVLEIAAKSCEASFIVQGTLYTDISESGGGYNIDAKKAQIKIHHNIDLDFSLEEICPLKDCVKDTGRNIGRVIGVPEELLTRHPFPGPGLVVRIEGEVTAENLAIARQLDEIYIQALRDWNLYETVWQAGAVVTKSIHTCTKGDGAKSGILVVLWAVWSINGFTAQCAELPWDFIAHISKKITNEIPLVGAVSYRISSKPPTTIEWG